MVVLGCKAELTQGLVSHLEFLFFLSLPLLSFPFPALSLPGREGLWLLLTPNAYLSPKFLSGGWHFMLLLSQAETPG